MAKPNVVSKEELINFAKECLVENGIEKFTLRAVAERGGVTQGTVYYHFRTKEQLLLNIVKDICDSSWSELSQSSENLIKQALESAKGRCGEDSFFHKLFFTLMVAGLNNEKIREQLRCVLEKENKALSDNLTRVWSGSPINGVSLDTWGVLFNAMVDGLALQALMIKDFPVETVYEGIEKLFTTLSNVTIQEGGK
ncbi:MAG TPA: TetR family transcriptional regulator [Bacillus sp. (in: Bacteria)]|uniref:AcrR family transcriptional regulator n=1 Tax=Anoxybacillus andreesenii TaxID=1325932 RepID=A0ABT9V979_9BACL|nr:TetR/AcrR family transcriptional regulator [Robertmurraya andreesenii]MDQ0157513.1 AcrR family transcriptional regulator [Robertmurraya andreesenii]HCX47597.1 TetR family transcriptional regulator [Bacillus sp. (in: firmicutes)]